MLYIIFGLKLLVHTMNFKLHFAFCYQSGIFIHIVLFYKSCECNVYGYFKFMARQ